MVRFGSTLSWRAHRQREWWFMCWFMPAHKSDVWFAWLHRIYGDGRVELLIWLAVAIFDMFELSPLWRSVLELLLLYSVHCCFAFFGCACSEWPPGLRYFNVYYIFLSSPPDGPSSGTESNLPVSHPTPGIQIVDYTYSSCTRWDSMGIKRAACTFERVWWLCCSFWFSGWRIFSMYRTHRLETQRYTVLWLF